MTRRKFRRSLLILGLIGILSMMFYVLSVLNIERISRNKAEREAVSVKKAVTISSYRLPKED